MTTNSIRDAAATKPQASKPVEWQHLTADEHAKRVIAFFFLGLILTTAAGGLLGLLL